MSKVDHSTAAMLVLHPVLRWDFIWGAAMMAELQKREEEAGIVPEQALDMFMRATAVQVCRSNQKPHDVDFIDVTFADSW